LRDLVALAVRRNTTVRALVLSALAAVVESARTPKP
jgi:hypothetical protein